MKEAVHWGGFFAFRNGHNRRIHMLCFANMTSKRGHDDETDRYLGQPAQGSLNSALLRAATASCRRGPNWRSARSAAIPLYDGDVEAESGIPEAVTVLKDEIIAADGLLLVTPDTTTPSPVSSRMPSTGSPRPRRRQHRLPQQTHRHHRRLTGASAPSSPKRLAPHHAHLRRGSVDGRRLLVSHADKVFDAEGALVDDKVKGSSPGSSRGLRRMWRAEVALRSPCLADWRGDAPLPPSSSPLWRGSTEEAAGTTVPQERGARKNDVLYAIHGAVLAA